MKKILVTGGTGTLGRQVVDRLAGSPNQICVLSSKRDPVVPDGVKVFKGDLITGDGLIPATHDADLIIHCASNPRDPQQTDVNGTRNLLEAIDKDEIRHLIYISIVGIDKTDYPYYLAKVEVERMIAESGIPYSILRATQFHDMILNIIRAFNTGAGHISVPLGMRFQSIAVEEVAERLAGLTYSGPAGFIHDMGGPEVQDIETLVRIYLDAFNLSSTITPEPVSNARYDLFRSGVNLCPGGTLGRVSWAQFLQKQA